MCLGACLCQETLPVYTRCCFPASHPKLANIAAAFTISYPPAPLPLPCRSPTVSSCCCQPRCWRRRTTGRPCSTWRGGWTGNPVCPWIISLLQPGGLGAVQGRPLGKAGTGKGSWAGGPITCPDSRTLAAVPFPMSHPPTPCVGCRSHGAPPDVQRWFIDHLTGDNALMRKAQVRGI